MDKTMVKRLATQTGLVDNWLTKEQYTDALVAFANACCAWQKEQDAEVVREILAGEPHH